MARKKKRTTPPGSKLKTGPEGGKYRLVKWYNKKRRGQATTLFGESWHRPSLLASFKKEAAKKGRKRR